jgi:hypothetical protein
MNGALKFNLICPSVLLLVGLNATSKVHDDKGAITPVHPSRTEKSVELD